MSQRNSDLLALVYDRLSTHSLEPGLEIQRIAYLAKGDGFIDDRLHTVLKRRVPFIGESHLTVKGTGQILSNPVNGKRVSQLERDAYMGLNQYLNREELIGMPIEDRSNVTIERILWENGVQRTRIISLFSSHIGRVPTISEVREYLNDGRYPLDSNHSALRKAVAIAIKTALEIAA